MIVEGGEPVYVSRVRLSQPIADLIATTIDACASQQNSNNQSYTLPIRRFHSNNNVISQQKKLIDVSSWKA
jgi:hypothetical protein